MFSSSSLTWKNNVWVTRSVPWILSMKPTATMCCSFSNVFLRERKFQFQLNIFQTPTRIWSKLKFRSRPTSFTYRFAIDLRSPSIETCFFFFVRYQYLNDKHNVSIVTNWKWQKKTFDTEQFCLNEVSATKRNEMDLTIFCDWLIKQLKWELEWRKRPSFPSRFEINSIALISLDRNFDHSFKSCRQTFILRLFIKFRINQKNEAEVHQWFSFRFILFR